MKKKLVIPLIVITFLGITTFFMVTTIKKHNASSGANVDYSPVVEEPRAEETSSVAVEVEPKESQKIEYVSVKPTGEGEAKEDIYSHEAVQAAIASMEALKAEYEGKLNALEASYREKYENLPSEEKTDEKKAEMRKALIEEANQLEVKCNASVDELLQGLTKTLIAEGKETLVVNDLQFEYRRYKAEKIQMYNERLGQ